jgi:UDP-N-acetylglucosamine 2-epimerase (non-hydrolysing)
MGKLRLTVIIGTRPEAIKLVPLILAARERPEQFDINVVRTGQHRELVDQLMDEFGVHADVDLNVMQPNQDLSHVLAESLRGLSKLIAEDRPDWVLVQGDTTTTFAGALAGFYNRSQVGHVEAGLRTGDLNSPFPEEANRSLTARLANLHFAPTEQARGNLLREGIAEQDIVLTGNTVVDALLQALARSPVTMATHQRYILVTVHRRENHGAVLLDICDGLVALLERHRDVLAIIPMHPHPKVRDVLIERVGWHERIRLTEPLGYTEFVGVLSGAILVLTDSGGVQEECAVLGKPMLIMREHTERPEALDTGVSILVGTSSRRIMELGSAFLCDSKNGREKPSRSTAFGDGSASTRILDALLTRIPVAERNG